MQNCTPNGERGASLVELIVVLLIVVVVATMAIIGFGRAPEIVGRQNLARQFKVYLERARFDSMKRRAYVCHDMSRVTILDEKSFSLTVDSNQNGRLDVPGETQVINVQNPRDMQIVGNGLTLPATVRFDERGHALLTDCVTAPPPNVPLFYFCNGPCTPLTATAQNSNVLFVSPTGTVAMLPGGSTVPTFNNPNVSNVAPNSQINPLLSVWLPTAAAPAPTPSPGPSGSPVASPLPLDCPVAPPQRPAETGCNCRPPMWVRADGYCM